MATTQSAISIAEDSALDLVLVIQQAAADGEITPRELATISSRAQRLHKRVRKAHRKQREAVSILRYGVVVTQITREFGPEGAEDDEDDLSAA